MNRVYPNLIIVRQPNFSNATGDSYVDQLQGEISKLKEDLKNETDFFDLHTQYLKQNTDLYNKCLTDWVGNNAGPYAGYTKATCDAQLLPNVKAEEKKVFDSGERIKNINASILAKENRVIEYLREKAKTDPKALQMLQEIEGKKSNKTLLIIVISIVGIGLLIAAYFYFKKKKQSII